jgi:N-acetyl-anhydromuramyl-L-alanine amidase AmpD
MVETDYRHAVPAFSPNFGYPSRGDKGRLGHLPVAVVLHTTGGPLGATLNWFRDQASKVSAHYVVARSGTVYQCVYEGDSAWANGWQTQHDDGSPTSIAEKIALYEPQGTVDWLRACLQDNVNPNLVTLSIETEGHPGLLLASAQRMSVIGLLQDIRDRNHLLAIPDRLIGHNGVDLRTRAHCPGFDGKDWQAIYSGWLLPLRARMQLVGATE